MGNQFSTKLIKGNLLNKFIKCQHKSTNVWVCKDKTLRKDYEERKKRISCEKIKISTNIINDLFYSFRWPNNKLIYEKNVDGFCADFYDEYSNRYFEITEATYLNYDSKEKILKDITDHPVIALINQKIFYSEIKDNQRFNSSMCSLINQINQCIIKKEKIYKNFDKNISLIIYFLVGFFPRFLDKNDQIIKNNKEEILKSHNSNFIKEFQTILQYKYTKKTNFKKIYLVIKTPLTDSYYIDTTIILKDGK